MHATNFDKKDIDRVNSLLEFIQNNKYSKFYEKNLRGIDKINSYEDFLKIPILSKNDILQVPLIERSHIPQENIKYYTVSSGTTKTKIPSIIPHEVYHYDEFTYNVYDFIQTKGNKKILILLSESSPGLVGNLFSSKDNNIAPIIGNVKNFNLTAQIAKEIDINGIFTGPTILREFIKSFEVNNFDTSNIHLISLGSEFCSIAMLEYFKKIFPNAYFDFRYACSEFHGKIGIRCQNISDKEPGMFHISEYAIMEIVDENGNILPYGEFGEIVITDVIKKAFPLIRYKTGDIGRIIPYDCECQNNYLLELSGRNNSDYFKFHGVVLKTEALYNSIKKAACFEDDKFEAHVYEIETNGTLLPKIIIKAKLKDDYMDLREDKVFTKSLAQNISNTIQLSSSFTLSDLVEKGIFLPLEIEYINKWEDKLKTVSIFPHF